MQLAIDTSTETAGLALVKDRQVIAELAWRCGRSHTIQLLPNLQYLLDRNSLSLEDTDCIIVARGPGSYNGLRVGLSTARGLAFSLDIPVVGISTLEAEAWQHADKGLPVCPVLNAGRDEVATATYIMNNGHWTSIREERLTSVEALCAETETKTLFCGEYVYSIAGVITEKLKEKAVIVSPAACLRRPAYLAELGLKRIDAGDYDNPATLQPHYFRGPSITKPNPGKK